MDTVRSIERSIKPLPLTEELAQVISIQTGISVEWLLAGNAKAKPLDVSGKLYTKDTFERTRAKLATPGLLRDGLELSPLVFSHYVSEATAPVVALILYCSTQPRFQILNYKFGNALMDLFSEFAPETLPKSPGGTLFATLSVAARVMASKWKNLTLDDIDSLIRACVGFEYGGPLEIREGEPRFVPENLFHQMHANRANWLAEIDQRRKEDEQRFRDALKEKPPTEAEKKEVKRRMERLARMWKREKGKQVHNPYLRNKTNTSSGKGRNR